MVKGLRLGLRGILELPIYIAYVRMYQVIREPVEKNANVGQNLVSAAVCLGFAQSEVATGVEMR